MNANTNMYTVIVTSTDNTDYERRDVDSRFSNVVKFIARETGMTQREVRKEISAREDGKFNRDNLGFRVVVHFN